MFEQNITPSWWTLCNVFPVHAKNCLDDYGFGLGCNSMEAREQKHQQISKYAHNTTFQCRWPMIFRHEFLQLIFLRENGYDEKNYRKRSISYIPDISVSDCQICGLKLSDNECIICSSNFMSIVNKKVLQ